MNVETFKPIGDRVLVKEDDMSESQVTTSGIIIPDSVLAEEVKTATVIKSGPGLYTQNGVLIPMTVKENDKVIIQPYAQGSKIKLEGIEYILYRESDILGII